MTQNNEQDITREQRAEDAWAMARELVALRKLTLKLHKRAAQADPQFLRTILTQREAVLESMKLLLPAIEANDADNNVGAHPADSREEPGSEEQQLVRETVAEIQTLDNETGLILRDRAAKISEEIHKLHAGKRFRDTTRRWA